MHKQTRYLALISTLVLLCTILAGAAQSATSEASPASLTVKPSKWTRAAGGSGLTMRPQQTSTKSAIFSEGFEGAFPGNWTLTQDAATDPVCWGVTNYRKTSGTKSLYCGEVWPGSLTYPHKYPNSVAGAWVTYGPFDLSGETEGRATFKIYVKTEEGFDWVKGGLSLNNVDYEGIMWTGFSSGWISAEVPFNHPSFTKTYLGASSVYFSFWFHSDQTTYTEGVYLDDFKIVTGPEPSINSLVTTPNTTPVKGVTLTLSGSTLYTYTGADGRGSLKPPAGTYTITPKKPGMVFTPASRTVTLGSAAVDANFTATMAPKDGIVKYYGVCVGIDEYQYQGDVGYALEDAVDFRNSLLACGWTIDNLALLKDSQATKATIKAVIEAKMALTDGDDVFVYFHSGYGEQSTDMDPVDEVDGYDEYLTAFDSTSSPSTAIRDDELGLWLSNLGTRNYLVLINAHSSGGQIKSRSTYDFGADILHTSRSAEINTRDLSDLDAGAVITASDDSEIVQEHPTLQNSVFTYYLVQGINSGAADLNRDRLFSATELHSYVAPLTHAYNPSQNVILYHPWPLPIKIARLQTIMMASTPARGATGVNRTANLKITYRYPVNQASAQGKLRLKTPTGSYLYGTYTWTTPNRVVVFNPYATLAANTTYTITCWAGVQPLTGPKYWYGETIPFTTGIATAAAALSVQAAAAPTNGDLTQITVNLTAAARVAVVVTNLAGRTVAVLPSQDLQAGLSNLLWNGKSLTGSKVPKGQYLIRLKATDGDGNSATCLAPLKK